MLLQRAMSDFGADESFIKACRKLKEHYGVIIPISSERRITITHANVLRDLLAKEVTVKNKKVAKQHLLKSKSDTEFVISETDGSMVPIVKNKKSVKDKRKNKETMYREARLTLAYGNNGNDLVFSATFGDVDMVGKHIK